jgi:hypothetical protein
MKATGTARRAARQAARQADDGKPPVPPRVSLMLIHVGIRDMPRMLH